MGYFNNPMVMGGTSMITSVLMLFAMMASTVLPLGVLIYTMWKYSKDKIKTDNQLGTKIVLHFFRYAGISMVIIGISALLGTVFFKSLIKGLYRTLLPLVLSGGIVYGLSQYFISKHTNDNQFPFVRQGFTTILVFGFLGLGMAGIVGIFLYLFQLDILPSFLGRYIVGIILFTAATLAAGLYFLNVRMKDNNEKLSPSSEA